MLSFLVFDYTRGVQIISLKSSEHLHCTFSSLLATEAWFPLGFVLPFVARFGFLYQQSEAKSHNEQCDVHMETYTKSQNDQPKASACFGFWDRTDSSSKTRTSNEKQQKATKSIFHSHFHSFALILDHWKVADIKSYEKPERAKTATKSRKQKRPKQASWLKNQTRQ